jgi:hypothetical protein
MPYTLCMAYTLFVVVRRIRKSLDSNRFTFISWVVFKLLPFLLQDLQLKVEQITVDGAHVKQILTLQLHVILLANRVTNWHQQIDASLLHLAASLQIRLKKNEARVQLTLVTHYLRMVRHIAIEHKELSHFVQNSLGLEEDFSSLLVIKRNIRCQSCQFYSLGVIKVFWQIEVETTRLVELFMNCQGVWFIG